LPGSVELPHTSAFGSAGLADQGGAGISAPMPRNVADSALSTSMKPISPEPSIDRARSVPEIGPAATAAAALNVLRTAISPRMAPIPIRRAERLLVPFRLPLIAAVPRSVADNPDCAAMNPCSAPGVDSSPIMLALNEAEASRRPLMAPEPGDMTMPLGSPPGVRTSSSASMPVSVEPSGVRPSLPSPSHSSRSLASTLSRSRSAAAPRAAA
jgi:hypothetical protein